MKLKVPGFSFSLTRNFLISTAIPLIIVTLLIAGIYRRSYTRDVYKLVDNSLVSIAENIDVYLMELDRATLLPYYNEDFFLILNDIMKNPSGMSSLDQIALENSIGYLMSFVRYTRQDILGSIIVADNDCLYSTTNMVNSSVADNYPFSSLDWYQEAVSLRGVPVFVAPHKTDYYIPNTNPEVISIARAIVNLRTREPLCVMKVDANTVIFEKILKEISFHVPSRIIIMDQNNNIIYSNTSLNRAYSEALASEGNKITIDGSSYLKRGRAIGDYGWTVHVLLDEKAMNSNTAYIFATALVLYLIGIITALAFYFLRSRNLVRTVDTINQMLDEIQNGSFQIKSHTAENMELQIIIDSVHYVAELMEEKIQREYQLTLQTKSFQFKALQAQINPHFLFNTLNGFIALNQLDKRSELEKALYSLTNMLRYSLSEASDSTLEEEMNFLSDYCSLQQLRFRERLLYSVDYPPETADFRVPKLLLQPLVENAIIHGIEPLSASCHLDIHALHLKDNEILITIEDDGIGFDITTSMPHIGLENVRNRLMLLDPDNHMEIESAPGEGTIITILIKAGSAYENIDC